MKRKINGREEQKMVPSLLPPLPSSASAEVAIRSDEDRIWKRFRDVGSLDEESLKNKDMKALEARLNQLKSELYNYQHNMGLLLMDRKNWEFNYIHLELVATKLKDKLKQEKHSHLIALSDAKKREESLRSVLEVEKHSVCDLEKALRALHVEFEEMKSKSAIELAQAHNMVVSIEKKSLGIESTLNAFNMFLAEENNKHIDVDRRLNEVEALEDALWREHQSLESEREAYEIKAVHEKQNLRDWEKKLQEAKEKLLEGQKLLLKREDFANERIVAVEQIEKDLLKRRKQIEEEQAALHEEDTELSARLADLRTQEENTTKCEMAIKKKEHELLLLKENLTSREHVEIPRLLVKQKDDLEVANAMFEAELKQRCKSLEDELERQRHLAELRASDINVKEAELLERDKLLKKKDRTMKEIEEGLGVRLTSLKERKQALESEEQEIKKEKIELEGLREIVITAKQDLEILRRVIEEEKQQIRNEQGKLTVIEEENSSFQNLHMKIKEGIDDVRASKKDVVNEANQLKREKERLDGDYRILNELKKQAEKEFQKVGEETQRVLKWHHDEGKRLEQEKHVLMEQIEMDTEALCVETEAFIDSLKHERAEWFAKFEKERNDLVQDFELQRNELARSMDERHKQIESWLQERELEFPKMKEREMHYISVLKKVAHREVEGSSLARKRHEKERQEINKIRKQTEMRWSAMKKDIMELQIQRDKLKQQRESLQKEREETLREFEELQKLKSDLKVSEYSLTLSKQEALEENVNEGEFIHEGSPRKICERKASLLVSSCHLPFIHGHALSGKKSESHIMSEEVESLPEDAAVNLMGHDIEHAILSNEVGDDHVQNCKAKVSDYKRACPFGAVAEDTELALELHSYRGCKVPAVGWEERRNAVGRVHDEETSGIAGVNLAHTRLNSVTKGDDPQDSVVLPVIKQEDNKKGNP